MMVLTPLMPLSPIFGSVALAQILYSAPFTYTLDANGKTIVENKGSGTDMVLSTGRAINLDPTQDLTIPIHYTLGTTTVTNGEFTVNSSWSGVSGVTEVITDGQLEFRGNVDDTLNEYDVYQTLPNLGTNNKVSFEITNYVSGSFDIILGGGGDRLSYYMPPIRENGVYEIILDDRGSTGKLYLRGIKKTSDTNSEAPVFNIKYVKVEPITNPNSFLTYTDMTTGEVITVDNSISPATTYTFNNQKVNNILTHKTPWSAAGKAKIDADPNLIGKLAMSATGSIAELDMTLDADDSYYMGSENNGAGVYDARHPQAPFMFTWVTTTANEVLTLPVTSAEYFNYYVDWGDGTDIEYFNTTGSQTHTYAIGGTYQVKIIGLLGSFGFNNTGDIAKVVSLDGLGETRFESLSGFMFGGVNITSATMGELDTSSVTSMYAMMRGLSSMTTTPDLSNFDTSSVTNMAHMMHSWSSMTTTPDLSSFDTSNVTSMYAMMYGWSNMGEIGLIGIENFNINSLTNATNMLKDTTLATATYDLILINWEAQPHQSNVTVHFGNSKYTLGSAAETARTNLINDGWVITDAGGI